MTDEEKAISYETLKHIINVRNLLDKVITEIIKRSKEHDKSKMGPALRHHYWLNRHHPEYFRDKKVPGFLEIECMNLVDLIEMLCDWKAATLRHDDGDILKSIEINQKRFGLTDQLVKILNNTVSVLDR